MRTRCPRPRNRRASEIELAVVCFVTCRSPREMTLDDRRAAAACRARGMRVASAPWEDPVVEWGSFDAIVVRSAWTYHLDPAGFDGWIDRVARGSAQVFNPPERMRWNARKEYLFDLERRGIPVVPSMRVADRSRLDPEGIESALGSREVVAKPFVGASAHGVVRGRVDRRGDRRRFERALAGGPLLVQRFVPEITERGEWSLVHLGGSFSHAVLKKPAPGEFRVQERLGGTTRAAEPPPAVADLAARTLAAAGGSRDLYARVDVVETAEGPILMELELIEPSLFFGHSDRAPARFAEALERALGEA